MPEGLAAACAAGALTGTPAVTPGLFALPGFKAAAVIALAGAVGILSYNSAQSLRERDSLLDSLQSQANLISFLREKLSQSNAAPVAARDDSQLREVARLRAKAAQLQNDLDAAKAQAVTAAARAGRNALAKNVASSLSPNAVPQGLVSIKFFTLGSDSSARIQNQLPPAPGFYDAETAAQIEAAITNDPGGRLLSAPRVVTQSDMPARITVGQTAVFNGGPTNIGFAAEVLPKCASESDAIDMSFNYEATRINRDNILDRVSCPPLTTQVRSGRTFLMFAKLPGTGPWFE